MKVKITCIGCKYSYEYEYNNECTLKCPQCSKENKMPCKLPGLPTQAANFTKAVIKHISTGMQSTDNAEKAKRSNICNRCDSNINGRCKECGCFINKKISWKDQECPLKKWV